MEYPLEPVGCIRKERSSTFSEYDSVTRSEHELVPKQPSLVMSPLSSAVSGGRMQYQTGRRRSETWHGALLPKEQDEEDQDARVCSSSTLKDVLHEIIVKELRSYLGSDCDLMCGEELVELSETISRTIGDKAKRVVASGTKIVSCVFIGEIRDDGIEVASQCLLDHNRDAFACANYKTSAIFAVAALFAVPT